MSSLHDRLRAVIANGASSVRLKADTTGASATDASAVASGFSRTTNFEAELGGAWREDEAARCFVVDRRFEASVQYGRATVGALADQLASSAVEAPLVAGGAPARPPFLFLDLETTGLSGGAGTHAFLVGCAWFEPDGAFVTRQFMLTRFADERRLLFAAAAEFERAGAIVSFNGKSFDAPVLETRYLFHRLPWPCGELPHIDLLHPARRFWRPERVEGRDDESGCSLCALERQVLGARRTGDVPGFEIPRRYFQFIRSGDARPLAPVLEHNRLDLLSLAALTARLLHLVRSGPEAARDGREVLALGRIYWRAGLDARARDAFERAAALLRDGPLRVDALRSLALAWRRSRQYEKAASCWRALLDVRGRPPHVAREATEALAIHHEHRIRDLATAKAFALRGLETGRQATAALQHRLSRLDRKMEQVRNPRLEL